MPTRKLSRDEIRTRLAAFKQDDTPWQDGRTWAYVYDPGDEALDVIKEAYSLFLSENGLDPTAFPSAMRLENEVVALCCQHLRAGPEVVGNFTSGGTESILLAVKTARDHARATRPGITRPNIVAPTTAHAAFHKAGHYLSVDLRTVPVDPRSFRADPALLREAIDDNTILLIGSAVSYAHGVVDPIPALGELALEKGVLLHVDGCMGGFLLPYFRRLGGSFPEFDWTVPGVSSISMDLHKYAFAAKGASVILYRDAELRRHQIYTCADWTGYSVVNPTVQSSKSAGPIAGAWAALHFIGDTGYLELARVMRDATRTLCAGIEAIPGCRILGRPDMNLIAFSCNTASVFHIVDEMKERGWFVQAQLGYGPSPANIHLSVNPKSAPWCEDFLGDLSVCVEQAETLPAPDQALRERALRIDPAAFSAETFFELVAAAGLSGTGLPGRMAGINELMDALPATLREKLLGEYLNQIYRPTSPG